MFNFRFILVALLGLLYYCHAGRGYCVTNSSNINGAYVPNNTFNDKYYQDVSTGYILEWTETNMSNIISSNTSTWMFKVSRTSSNYLYFCAQNISISDPVSCTDWVSSSSSNETLVIGKCEKDTSKHDRYEFLIEELENPSPYLTSILSIIIFGIWIYYCCVGKCNPEYYEASSIDTYNKMLEIKGYEYQAKPEGHDESLGELVLRDDWKSDKVVWSNNFWLDFMLYIRTNIPVFSIFSENKNHHVERYKKRWVFATLLLINFAMSCFLLWLVAVINDDQESMLLTFSILLAPFLFIFEKILVKLGKCTCFDECSKCIKDCINYIRMGTIILIFVAVLVWAMLCTIFFSTTSANSGVLNEAWGALLLTFVSSSFKSWFLISICYSFVEFYVLWQTYHPENNPEDIYQPITEKHLGVECTCNKRCTDKRITYILKIIVCPIQCLTCGCLCKEEQVKESKEGCCCKKDKETELEKYGKDFHKKFRIHHHDYIKYKNDTLAQNNEVDLMADFAITDLKKSVISMTKKISKTYERAKTEEEGIEIVYKQPEHNNVPRSTQQSITDTQPEIIYQPVTQAQSSQQQIGMTNIMPNYVQSQAGQITNYP